MTRLTLERQQIWIYLTAIGLGLAAGHAWPGITPFFEGLLWPVLALLLYSTFMQIPLLHVRDAFQDHRFIVCVLIGNFILIPLLAWGLMTGVPTDPAIQLGLLLVLLVPCTDWFITFCQLGGGSLSRAISITPINLLLQLALLPAYLWLMFEGDISAFGESSFVSAILIVVAPLLIAAVSERWMEARPERAVIREAMAWGPVPLLAVVVFLIAAVQVQTISDALDLLPFLVPVFATFLVLAALVAKLLARLMRIPADQGRTLAFSLGTRNSFVVLPIALSLPSGWELTAVVIVIQSLVELIGMIVYLWWLPRHLFR